MGILPLKGFSTLLGTPSVKLIITIVFFTPSNSVFFFFSPFPNAHVLSLIYCLSCVFEFFFTFKICLQVNDDSILFVSLLDLKNFKEKKITWHQFCLFPTSGGEIYARHGWILRGILGDIVKFFWPHRFYIIFIIDCKLPRLWCFKKSHLMLVSKTEIQDCLKLGYQLLIC